MNKRMKKKHKWLGAKLAGANYCANEIFHHILRKMIDSGIPLKPCYMRNAKSYVRWFFHNSSEKEWEERVTEACYSYQMFFSAKHLLRLPADYTSFDGRYKPNPPLKDMLDELVKNTKRERKEAILSGENVHIMHRLDYLIKSYEEYGTVQQVIDHLKYAKGAIDMVDKNE